MQSILNNLSKHLHVLLVKNWTLNHSMEVKGIDFSEFISKNLTSPGKIGITIAIDGARA